MAGLRGTDYKRANARKGLDGISTLSFRKSWLKPSRLKRFTIMSGAYYVYLHCEGFSMLISGTVAVMAMGGALAALIVASVVLAMLDSRYDASRRHWQPAESSTHW